MADKKELYEVLFEEINHKMNLVLEGYSDMGRKFEEARIERQQIKEDMIYKIGFVANDLQETKADLRETKDYLNGKIKETRAELRETRECLTRKIQETRAELGQKVDKIGEIIEDHETRIETLEKNASVG
jgi:Mg2+ and Co2+ transporter CorA